MIGQVVSAYLKAAERELGRLAEGAPELQAKAAHALKSSSFNVGAHHFAACCKAVEDAARDGQVDVLPARIRVLRVEWGRVEAELSAVMNELSKK